MAQAGALKAAAKRTAFGDLSSTANLPRTLSRDDSVIGAKGVIKQKENLAPIQEKRQTTFQKPAQRPISMNNLRSLVSSTTNIHRQPLVESKQRISLPSVSQAPATRKIGTRKSTAVFKDVPVPEKAVPEQVVSDAENVPAGKVSVAPVHRALPALPTSRDATKEDSTTLDEQRAYTDVLESQEEPILSSDTQEIELPNLDSIQVAGPEAIVPSLAPQQNEPPEEPNHDLKASDAKLVTNHFVSRVPLVDHASRPSASAYPELARPRKLPPVSEPEEYWEEEEIAENYEEDGYVTARSFKSRGDNTTGGATTLLFPKQTQKAKQEVALAKQLIEGSKTIEELEDEAWDTTMVAEYNDEIFQYMRELEVRETSIL